MRSPRGRVGPRGGETSNNKTGLRMFLTHFSSMQEDLHDLGREYFTLARQVIADDPNEALKLFGFRRPNQMLCIFRLSAEQLDTVLTHAGLPFGLNCGLSVRNTLAQVDSNKLIESPFRPEWQQYVERLQMAYWERVRNVALDDPAAAATIFRFPEQHSMLTRVARMRLSELRRLAKLNVALRINQSVGFDLLLSLVEGGASHERIAIAGMTAWASGGSADESLKDRPGEFQSELPSFHLKEDVVEEVAA